MGNLEHEHLDDFQDNHDAEGMWAVPFNGNLLVEDLFPQLKRVLALGTPKSIEYPSQRGIGFDHERRFSSAHLNRLSQIAITVWCKDLEELGRPDLTQEARSSEAEAYAESLGTFLRERNEQRRLFGEKQVYE